MVAGVGPLPLEGDAPVFGLSNFDSRPLFPSQAWSDSGGAQAQWTDIWFTNHIFQAVLGALIVIGFWLWASRGLKVVPTKRQFIAESLYNLVRNGVARETIGHDFHKYVPYLVALFCFILVNNLFGEFALFMFPTFSKIGFVWALAISTWILYNAVGIKKNGPLGYLKKMTMPAGVPKPLLILIIPLEFLSNFITRPLTLCLRLFANLLAGHLIVGVFVVGGTWLLLNDNLFYNFAGGVSLIASFAIFALEIFVGCLQAYVFTVLTAQYVSSSLSEH
jgi:F-type H+-transporting ATPase subunit a